MTEKQRKAFLEFCKADGFDLTDVQNKNQYRAVMDDVSIIPAGAGSGKTAVLAHRFLRLVMDGIHVDEILTITFTRDATSNMKGRIYSIIKKAVLSGIVDKEELDRFSNAAISTTDSLCSNIVRKDCIRYGIAPDFSIDDEDNLRRESDSVTDRILEKYEDSDSLGDYLVYINTDNIKETLFCIARDYISFDQSFSYDITEKVKEIVKNHLDSAINDFHECCNAYIQNYEETEKPSPTFTSNVAIVKKFIDMDTDTLSINVANFKVNGAARKGEALLKQSFSQLCISLNASADESSNLLRFTQTIVSEFAGEIIKYKRKSKRLTFSDILKLSIDILKSNEDIRKYYNSTFKAVMVDEFQDNNSYNRSLVYLLCLQDGYKNSSIPKISDIDKSKLFMVGDEKQSIYRFRNADVSVFKSMSRDFGEDRRVGLSRNFRSEGALIDKINIIFSRIMPSEDEKSSDYEAVFCGLSSINRRIEDPRIRFLYLIDNKDTRQSQSANSMTSIQSEAYRVAKEIYEAVNSDSSIYRIKDGKTPEYGDIAVLLRGSTHQSIYEKAFRCLGIPFVSQQSKSLTMDSIANDFYLILYLAVYGLSDLLIFASYLKSPFCGLTDLAIKSVIDNIKENLDGDNGLSESESCLYRNSLESIKKVNYKLSSNTLANTFSFIWNELGYRFIVLRNSNNLPFEEHFDYLFSVAVSFDSEGRNITDFLSYIKPMLGGECDEKDITVQREKAEGVTITSVHKSKGLEFPIVFVPDMASSGGGGGFRPNIYSLDENAVLPFSVSDGKLVNPFVLFDKSSDIDKDNAETKRILYVAATRAQYHLVFSSVLDGENPEKIEEGKSVSMLKYFLKGCGYKNSPVCFDYEVVDAEEFSWYDKGLLEKENTQQNNDGISNWYELACDTGSDFANRHIGVTSVINCQESDLNRNAKMLPSLSCDSLFNEENDGNAKFGTLVHSLIEDSIKNIERHDFYGDFASFKEKQEILDCAIYLKNNFINSSFFKTLCSFELYSERRFCLYDGKNYVQGVIDLLCISETESIIIDYKTDRYMQIETHREQLKYYSKAVRSAYPGKNVRAFLFYLRSGDAVEVDA